MMNAGAYLKEHRESWVSPAQVPGETAPAS